MDTQTLAQELLSGYGQIAGLRNLKFESHGCARLIFEGETAIDLEIDRGAACLQVYGVLGPVPAAGRDGLYRKLLEGNLFGTQTRGATLSIDPVQEEILLSRRVDVESATPAAFATLIEEFAGMVRHWREKLGSGELGAPASAPPALSMGDAQMGMYLRG